MSDLSQYKDLYLETAKEYIQALNEALLVLEKNPIDAHAIEVIFRNAHSLKSQSAAMQYAQTGLLCHTIEDVFYEIKNNRLKLDTTLANLLFSSFDNLKKSIQNIEQRNQEIDLQAQITELKKLTGVATEGVGKSVRSENSQPTTQETQMQVTSIPVGVKRLDVMLNLIEDLLVHQFELQHLSRELKHQTLTTYYETNKKILESLQFEIMQARTVPLKMIFDQYPRVVRDIAAGEGKQVTVVINGGELTLDRKIVEKLHEPLTHLVRNAVSHGIELQGTVTINARRDSDFAIIEVVDDGKGINWVKIAEKTGATPEDQKSKEDLLFSGVSTSETVSEISGRGVGLLAVKKMAGELGGSVSVRANEPSGTVFTLQLPLSVSIVKSLLITVGNNTYAIPAISVDRTILIGASDIKKTAQQEAIILGDVEVPIIRLAEYFQHQESVSQDQIFVVVVNVKKGKIGLVVDRALEAVDLVVKPIAGELSQHFFGGAAVLANGEVALLIATEKIN